MTPEESDNSLGQQSPITTVAPSGFDVSALYVFVGVLLLLPIFFLPFLSSPFQLTKTVLVSGGVLTSFCLFIIGRLRAGSLTVPMSLVLLGAWLIPTVYFFSALFSSFNVSISLVGQRFEPDTVFFVTIGVLLLTLALFVVREKQQILGIYTGFLFIFLLIALFQGLRLVFGTDFLSFGIFTSTVTNVVGKWNDLAIFFGVTTMLALVTLEGLSLHRLSQIVLYVVLAVSLFFLSVINFVPVWVTLGVFALAFLVYHLLKGRFHLVGLEQSDSETKLPPLKQALASFAPLVVLILSLFFVIGGDTVSDPVDEFFGINQLEVRPSWQGTVDIARATYNDNLVLGSGPNTFASQWELFKPEGINTTIFWNASFTSGIGFIPTSFITTGVLGGVAWVLFLGLLLYSGVKSLLFRPVVDSFAYYLSLSSFLVALYLWVFAIMYVPNAVIFFLSFLFTGLYLTSLRHRDVLTEKTLTFAENPRLGFISVLGLTVILIFSVVGVYLVGDRYIANIHFQRAVLQFSSEENEIVARRSLGQARERVRADTFSRFASELELQTLRSVLSDSTLSPEEQRAEFETVLGAAIENAKEAQELNPHNYQNWFTLGRVYQSVVPLGIQGAYESAKISYERALEVAPHAPQVYLALAELEVLNNDTEAAQTYIRQALEEKGNYTNAVFLLAQIQVNEGEIAAAIQSVEAASILEPNNPVIFFQLGLLKYNQSDWQGATSAFARAVALNSVYANARYFLGLSYYQLGDAPNALEQFEQVAVTNPNNEEVQRIIQNLQNGLAPLENISPPAEEPQDRPAPPISSE